MFPKWLLHFTSLSGVGVQGDATFLESMGGVYIEKWASIRIKKCPVCLGLARTVIWLGLQFEGELEAGHCLRYHGDNRKRTTRRAKYRS